MQQLVRVLLVLTLAWCGGWAQDNVDYITPNYVETGECPGDQQCSYSYSAQQQYFDEDESRVTKVTADVDITCTSSGMYNGSDAKLYCMTIRDPAIFTSSLDNSTEEDINEIQRGLDMLLSNWFCFAQSSTGKIPAVFHPPSEPNHAVSLKKAIAAAFQANFEGTEEEEEIDPQSRHTSHYTYEPSTEEGVKKMHRRISGKDVSAYSNQEVPDKDVDSSVDEEVEYRNGRLERSSGNSTFNFVNRTDSSNENDEGPDFSLAQIFSASGSYLMEVQSCRRLSKYTLGLKKKKLFSAMRSDLREEDLTATRDERAEGMSEMKELRAKLPDGSVLEALENYEEYGDKLFQILAILMKLELQLGPLPSYVPVIDDVMVFITNLPEMISESQGTVKEGIYMLLAEDGSLKSQMTLLNAYDNAADNREAGAILTHISFIENVRIGLVIAMEDRLNRLADSDDDFVKGQLLLVFASLATRGSDEVERRVMTYLTLQMEGLSMQSDKDVADIVLILQALGNTGSKASIQLIFDLLDTSTGNEEFNRIKLAVIDSLVKLTDDPTVLTRIEVILQDEPTAEVASAILNTLIDAIDYIKERKQDLPQYLSGIQDHTLLYTLTETVGATNDTDLHSKMEYYLQKIKAGDELFALLYTENSPLGQRQRRGTDWDASHDSNYNLVSSLSSRQSDVSTYPNHLAYINSHRIGPEQGNVRLSYGFFAGAGTHCDRAKAFGRGRADVTFLDYSTTAADARVEITATTTTASINAYSRVFGTTYYSDSRSFALSSPCYLYTRNLAEYRRTYTRSYYIFVYVGYLTLSANLQFFLTLDLNANMCVGRTGTEVTGALGALTPRVGVSVTGSVSGNLLEVARGGIDVTASFSYQLEPAVSVQGCTAYCSLSARVCAGIYDSFPDSYIDLETWYQTRSVRWCNGWWGVTYPCGFNWGSRNRVSSLSARWNYGRGRSAVYQYCYGNLHPTCAAGALSSPLFSY